MPLRSPFVVGLAACACFLVACGSTDRSRKATYEPDSGDRSDAAPPTKGGPDTRDSGTGATNPGKDAAPPPVDAGRPPTVLDAGRPPTVFDAGRPPTVLDAGRPPTVLDAGRPPTVLDAAVADAGPGAVDAGPPFIVNCTTPVQFADPALQSAVAGALGTATDSISATAAAGLANLVAESAGITKLGGIQCLTGLTSLDLTFNSVTDIKPLAPLQALTAVRLGFNKIVDVSVLANRPNLTYLELQSNPIHDPAPIATLTNLSYAAFSGDPISDLSSFAGYTGTPSFLDFTSCKISDISPLANLKIRGIALTYNPINDSQLATLATLTKLTQLFIDSTAITTVAPLTTLTSLYELVLGGAIQSLSPLPSIGHISNLQIFNGSTPTDLTPIATLPISILFIQRTTNITSFTAIASLTNLGWVDIESTNLADLTPFKNLANLNTLNLGYNAITDLSPLAANTHIGTGVSVTLDGNPFLCSTQKTNLQTMTTRGATVTPTCP